MHRAIRIAFFFALVYCIIYAEINSLQCDGARYREFLSRGTSIKAGEINRYEFTMLQFFLRRIDKGSRLRLVLTSP